MMLLTLLGAAGCMSWHRANTSAAGDLVSAIDPMIDPAEQAGDQCEAFGCEP